MALAVPAVASTGPRRLLAVTCLAFLALGMAGAAIGPAIPDLARQTHASTVAVGGMLSALFGGALFGQFASGPLLRRIGKRGVLFGGMIAGIAGGIGIATSGSLAWLIGATCALGLGFGGLTVAGNVLAAEASEDAGPLNLVNAMYGTGAIVSPALVGFSIVRLDSGVPALWIAPCVMLIAMFLLIVWAPADVGEPRPVEVAADHEGRPAGIIGSRLPWSIGAVIVEGGPVAGTAILFLLPLAMAALLVAIERQ